MINFIKGLFRDTYNEDMERALGRLSSGRTEQLNDKIEIYTIDYNKLLISKFNEGFEMGIKEASAKLEKAYRDIMRDMNYENKHILERKLYAEKISDEKVATGNISVFGKTVLAKEELNEFGIEVRCVPCGLLTLK